MGLTQEEADALIHIINENVSSFEDIVVANAITKIAATAGSVKVVKCGNCDDLWYLYIPGEGENECPHCGCDSSTAIEIGNRVNLPSPDAGRGETWREGDTGIVIGEQQIESIDYLLVTTNDGKTWIVEKFDCEKVS